MEGSGLGAGPQTVQFFLVGVQRCGTTWLARRLGRLPGVEMAAPERPEPKYFLRHDPGPGGVAHYLTAHFSGRPARARGEKGTSYLDHPHSWAAMLRAFPDARFVVVLRDPVERAVSHWRFSADCGWETLPAEQALCDEALERRPYDADRVSTSPYAYLSRGRYAEPLSRLFESVGRERVAVAFLEELRTDPQALGLLASFVGAEPGPLPTGWDRPVNKSDGRPVPEAVYGWLARYYAAPNAALAVLLGRPLPASWRLP